MLTVISVLKSGGIYDAQWVRKLRDAVRTHLSIPHRFVCLSDTDVPCERIPLVHGWPKWWSKLELFRPGVIQGETLYLDLDTVIVGSIDALATLPAHRFLMMRNFHRPEMPGSSIMWFGDFAPDHVFTPEHVYRSFAMSPEDHIAHHEANRKGPYLGDQAFIWEAMGRNVEFIDEHIPAGLVCSYRKHCLAGLPKSASLIAFGGSLKPSTVRDSWVSQAWI